MERMVFGIYPSWHSYHTHDQRILVGDLWGFHDLFYPVAKVRVRRSSGPCRHERTRSNRCRPIMLIARGTAAATEDGTPPCEGHSKSVRAEKQDVDAKKRSPVNQNLDVKQDPWAETLKGFQEHLRKFLRTIHSQWSTTVNLPGFNPDDIAIKVDDKEGMIRICASQESTDKNGFDRRETRKNIKLPEDIIPQSVVVSFRPSGTLHIMGRRNLGEEDAGMSNSDQKVSLPEKSCLSVAEKKIGTNENEMTGLALAEETQMCGPAENNGRMADKEETKEVSCPGKEIENQTDREETKETSGPTEEREKADTGETTQSRGTVLTESRRNASSMSENEAALDETRSVLTLDVSKFVPDQVSVKVVNNVVTVIAEDQREEEGFFSMHQVKRCFPLPTDIDPTSVKSYVDSEGVLTVKIGPPRDPTVDFMHEKAVGIERD